MTEDDDAEGASESRVEISPEEAFQMVHDPDR
jgi:hypothetical protein